MMATGDEIFEAAARAVTAAEHGELTGLAHVECRLAEAKDPLPRAWCLVLRAARVALEPGSAPAPVPADLAPMIEAGPEVRAIAVRAAIIMERTCLPVFDGKGLGAWVDLHARLVGAGSGTPPATEDSEGEDLALRAARLWQRLFDGISEGQETAAKALFDEAARRKVATQVVESTVLRALIALSNGSLDDAIELARRASRMAQSEALPLHEYLANVTLARVRRYSGRPHLALHILGALGRAAPATWSGWLDWERQLSGGPAPHAPTDAPGTGDAATPAARAARALAQVLDATRTGDATAFAAHATALLEAASVWPDAGREATALLAALDPTRTDIPPALEGWYRGDTAAIPCGLHGVGVSPDLGSDSESATAFVIAAPGQPGRRFLRPGLTLMNGARVLNRDTGRPGAGGVRTETGVAALALAGVGGMTREAFFLVVYGFPFVAQRHQAVLDVLCHRMRALLGSSGEIRRESMEVEAASRTGSLDGAANGNAHGASDGSAVAGAPSLALVLHESVIVPDMRCALPAADRVLRALAALGATSAKSAADSLRMPLRTVQAVLQQLVAEGACSIEREGRRVAYRIEDTTFTEVTTNAGA